MSSVCGRPVSPNSMECGDPLPYVQSTEEHFDGYSSDTDQCAKDRIRCDHRRRTEPGYSGHWNNACISQRVREPVPERELQGPCRSSAQSGSVHQIDGDRKREYL